MINFRLSTRPSLWSDFKARLLMHGVWTGMVLLSWCVGDVYYA